MTTDRVEKLYDDVFPGIDVWGVARSLVSIIYEGKTDTVYIEVYDDIGSFVGNWLMPAKELRELLARSMKTGRRCRWPITEK